MPRPRKPTEVLELTGAFRKDPQRRRPVGAKSNRALGSAPAHLSVAEIACWNELAQNSAEGLLTSAERWIVEIAATLMAKKRCEGLSGGELVQLVKTLSLIGATAVDRSKVHAPSQPQEASPADEFLN